MNKTKKEDTELFKKCIHLAITIADKYDNKRAYEAALEGLYIGLNVYLEKNRETELDLYLAWFIKTSIEYSIGTKNKDTIIWEKKLKEK